MTSKEALNKIKHHIDGTKLTGKEYLECMIQIDRDLEILEILKKKPYIEIHSLNGCLNYTDYKSIFTIKNMIGGYKWDFEELMLTEEEFNKIKEWLKSED